MTSNKDTQINLPLLIFDFVIMLPFTLIRILLIYFFGSRYNVKNCKFLDVLVHATGPFFNQQTVPSVDTIDDDVRMVIKTDTALFKDDNRDDKKENIFVESNFGSNVIDNSNIINSNIINSNIINSNVIDELNKNISVVKTDKYLKDDMITDTVLDTETFLDTDAVDSENVSETMGNNTNSVGAMLENVMFSALNDLDMSIDGTNDSTDQINEFDKLDDQTDDQTDDQSDDQSDIDTDM